MSNQNKQKLNSYRNDFLKLLKQYADQNLRHEKILTEMYTFLEDESLLKMCKKQEFKDGIISSLEILNACCKQFRTAYNNVSNTNNMQQQKKLDNMKHLETMSFQLEAFKSVYAKVYTKILYLQDYKLQKNCNNNFNDCNLFKKHAQKVCGDEQSNPECHKYLPKSIGENVNKLLQFCN